MGRFERRWRAASRRNWAILIACVGVVVTGILIALGDRPDRAVVVLPAPRRMAFETTPVEPVAEALGASTPAPTFGDRGDERVQVCGLGWVQARPDGVVDPEILERMPALRAARARLLGTLASSDDAFGRATSLWLGMVDLSTTALEYREQLAQQATTTQDARVYALAFKSCERSREAGSCALLNARRWAQVDVDNGEPWMYLHDEASARKDRQAAEDALFHLGIAPRIESRFFDVPGLLARRRADGDMGLLAANGLAVRAMGMSSAWSVPIRSILEACSDEAVVDSVRRQRCDAVATALVDRSDSMLYASMGARIGQRVGWPAARSDAVAVLSSANAESMPTQASDPSQWTCGEMAQVFDRIKRQAVVGEPGYAREWIQSGGRTFERYAQTVQARKDQDRAARMSMVGAALAASEPASDPSR